MANRKVKAYVFDVRETTSRMAVVEADSAAEARRLLNAWAAPGGSGAEDGAPITLSDYESIGCRFRSIRPPQ